MKRGRWWTLLSVLLLGPLATALLAAQIILVDHGRGAILLISLEAAIVLTSLLVILRGRKRTHELWIDRRILSESLKREKWLYRCGAGPYRELDDAAREHLAGIRFDEIESLEPETRSLVRLEDEFREWHAELDAGPSPRIPKPELAGRIERYAEERLRDQIRWYRGQHDELHRRDRNIEFTTHLILIAGLVLAVVHLVTLVRVPGSAPGAKLVEWLAVVLPAMGAGVFGYRSQQAYHRVARTYRLFAADIEGLEDELMELRQSLEVSEGDDPEIARRFVDLVLRAEETLAEETRHWWVIFSLEDPTPL